MDHPYDINYRSFIKDDKIVKLLLKNSKLEPDQLKELVKENDQFGIWSHLKTKIILNVGYSHDWGGEWGILKLGDLFLNFVEYGEYNGPYMSFDEALKPLEDYLIGDESTGTQFNIESSLPLKTTLKMFKNLIQTGESLTINGKTYTRTDKGLTLNT